MKTPPKSPRGDHAEEKAGPSDASKGRTPTIGLQRAPALAPAIVTSTLSLLTMPGPVSTGFVGRSRP